MALWDKIGSVGNVEDRRGVGGATIGGGAAILLLLAYAFLGGTPAGDVITEIINSQPGTQTSKQASEFAGQDSYEVFASKVMGSNDDLWSKTFAAQGATYEKPRLVLFRNSTQSGCGIASSQIGPHYCPVDRTIYLDESFFRALEQKLGAQGGEVAEAYVIAHEVGHHVQNLNGTMQQVTDADRAAVQGENGLSVKLELQADCYAGIWAKSVADNGVLEKGEINQAIDAAKSVGDDRIQQRTTGSINPEQWTHGSSAERVEWFNRGYEQGSMASCNTFGT